MDSRSKKDQWTTNSTTSSKSSNHVRCLINRMGCNLSEHEYRGILDKTGENVPHKHTRTEGSLPLFQAAFLALQTFAARFSNGHILLLIDNTTAIAYINHKGGTHSQALSNLTIEMWEWCLVRNLSIHIPGWENVSADMKSRRSLDASN